MIDFKQKLEENDQEIKQLAQAEEEDRLLEIIKKKRKAKTYFIALLVLALVFSGKVIMSSQGVGDWLSSNSFWNRVSHLASSDNNPLAGEENDRINILLIGIGGENHDGGYLADTIMLASIKPSTKQAALISIPRDLTAPISDGSWRKVNSIHALAEAKEKGSGGQAMMDSLGQILGTDIKYYVRIDFDGFIEIIDELGGVDIEVENTLDDYSYPIRGQEDNPNYYSRYEHLHIEKGLQHMNGDLALKYVRSRHAAGLEGSDFARAKRQQLVISAVKSKLLSRNTLLKPGMISRIVGDLNRNLKTNLDVWAIAKLWGEYKDIDRGQIISKVLSDGPDGLLISGRGEGGAYILIPKTGNFQQIKDMVANIFSNGIRTEKSSYTASELKTDVQAIENKNNISDATKKEFNNSEKIEKLEKEIKVAVLNGTWISGLAAESALTLQKYGFIITETSNAPTREYENSVIYDLSYGKELQALETLKASAQASLAYDNPSWLDTYKNSTDSPDFILIVGSAQKQ